MTIQNVTGSSFSSDDSYLMQADPRKARSRPSIFSTLSVPCSSSIPQQSPSSQKSSQVAFPFFSSSPPSYHLSSPTQAISFESEMRASSLVAQQHIDTSHPPLRKRRSKKQNALSTNAHPQAPFSFIQNPFTAPTQLHLQQANLYASPPMTVSPASSYLMPPSSLPSSVAMAVAAKEPSLQNTFRSPTQKIPISLQYPVSFTPSQQASTTRQLPYNPPPSEFRSTGQWSTASFFLAKSPSQLASANAIGSLETPSASFLQLSAVSSLPTPIHVKDDWQSRSKRRQFDEQQQVPPTAFKSPKTTASTTELSYRILTADQPVIVLAVRKMQHWLQEKGVNLDILTCQAALSSFFDPSNLPD